MRFYASVFPDFRLLRTAPGLDNRPLVMTIQIAGHQFVLLNGGPEFKFNEAVSFVVYCETQEEVDNYWDRLSDGGATSRCGWLKDKFGLSWQIVPRALTEMLSGDDRTQPSGR